MTLKLATGRTAFPIANSTLHTPEPLGAGATWPPCEYATRAPGGSVSGRNGAGDGSIAARSFPLAPRSLANMRLTSAVSAASVTYAAVGALACVSAPATADVTGVITPSLLPVAPSSRALSIDQTHPTAKANSTIPPATSRLRSPRGVSRCTSLVDSSGPPVELPVLTDPASAHIDRTPQPHGLAARPDSPHPRRSRNHRVGRLRRTHDDHLRRNGAADRIFSAGGFPARHRGSVGL